MTSTVLKDHAIILRTRKYGDTDLIVSLFTKERGRLSGLAKGAKNSRKRFGGALEPGSIIEILFEERRGELVFLKEAHVLEAYAKWRSFLEGMAVTGFALELALQTLPERHASPQKFDLLKNFLEGMELAGIQNALFDFQEDWLSALGWEPDFEQCGICGRQLSGGVEAKTKQKLFDHYWEHVVTRPFLTRSLLEEVLLV